ncbi:MAG: HEAT repeat domain-containing protein [Geobacteraceae bacterium]
MESERTKSVSVGLDVALIGAAVRELAGARRNVSSYPQGHPVVAQSCERAAEMLGRLCSDRETICLGVSRETLVTDRGSLVALVPASRNFVRTLAHHGVVSLTCRKGVTAGEVELFNQIITEKRAHIFAKGGIEQVVHDAGIRNLEVSCIQYEAFQAAESGQQEDLWHEIPYRRSLWETFVSRYVQEAKDTFSSGEELKGSVSPENLAGIVNSRSHESIPLLASVLEELIREAKGLELLSSEEKTALASIGEFVGGLKPELREMFYDSVVQSCQQQDSNLMEFLPHLPTSAALDIFNRLRVKKVVLPSYIMESMENLADALMKEADQGSHAEKLKQSGLEEKLHVVFREEIIDEFVPTDYLQTLKALVASQNIPEPSREDFLELTATLADNRIESTVSKIILESLSLAAPEQLLALKGDLLDLCRYFLEVGDFCSLENMYVRVCAMPIESEDLAALRTEILETFHSPEFVDEVLCGVESWGKDKFEEIGNLVQEVGDPFVEHLLDRLAEEERLTLRRYYLDQLMKMSGRINDAVCARLGDSRWYFIRNLVDILERSGDQGVVVHLRRVAAFPHPKVRQRVIDALLTFNDPEGDKLLMQGLQSRDAEARLSAIQQAGRSRVPEVLGALLFILGRRGRSSADFMEKKAAIQALAEIGDCRVLPLLERMLMARHFLQLSQWKSLKKDIVCSLVKYSDSQTLPLLHKIAVSGQRELASLAAQLAGCSGGNE